MKKQFSFLTAIVLAPMAALSLCACGNTGGPSGPTDTPEPPESLPENSYVMQLDYTESVGNLRNPDQGFYHPLAIKVTASGASFSTQAISSTRLCHLRFDLSAFSTKAGGTDGPLTQAALDGIANVFETMRKRDKNAVVRFCYDRGYAGNADHEPSLELMLSHARQFCPIVERYSAVVTSLELGMVGPWGEMHTSTAANATNVNALIGEFLGSTSTVPVAVRTPKRIYDYLGITVNDIDGYEMPSSAYRLGMFNDGYLGSSSDLGTFTDRTREVAFIAKQTAHLPYGGEVTVPESELHDISSCLPEMYRIHLSYLNEEWNDTVVNGWKSATVSASCAGADEKYYGQSAYNYIRDHMGYRFVMKKSTFSYTEKQDYLKVTLSLENKGFGNMNKPKRAALLFTDGAGNILYERAAQDYAGSPNPTFTADLSALDMQPMTYRVYLRLYGDHLEENDLPLYCVQLANVGAFDGTLKANFVGEFTVTEKSAE